MTGELRYRLGVVLLGATVLAASCSSGGQDLSTGQATPTTTTESTAEVDSTEPQATDGQAVEQAADELYPDVIAVEATREYGGTWKFDVTLSSPYDSPARYADAWRVRSVDGAAEYGVRILTHDHASEQPFTRSQSGIAIPPDVRTVVVEGRDQQSGWGGATVTFELPAG